MFIDCQNVCYRSRGQFFAPNDPPTALRGSPGDCIGPLRARNQSTWTHYLSRREYDQVSDNTDYLTYKQY